MSYLATNGLAWWMRTSAGLPYGTPYPDDAPLLNTVPPLTDPDDLRLEREIREDYKREQGE